MPEYRRWRQPGGMFFFTITTFERQRLFANKTNIELLWAAIRFCQEERPFVLTAYVIMPDHLHWIMELPDDDADYSSRVGRIKALFTKECQRRTGGPCPPYVSASREKHREGSIWQRRFWEHMIRDEDDFRRHVDYVHYNPVKHSLAACPHDWKESSFGQWVEDRVYERDWCCQCDGREAKVPEVALKESAYGE